MPWYKKLLSIFCSSSGMPDMGRILAFKTMSVVSGGFIYSLIENPHAPINWTELGTGYGVIMAGCVAFIGGKEIAVAKANAINGS
jgi:hypothetical protein